MCIVEDESYSKIVELLKRSKVFIACLSDEYANNNRCRMELQYAKKTLNIPVSFVTKNISNTKKEL